MPTSKHARLDRNIFAFFSSSKNYETSDIPIFLFLHCEIALQGRPKSGIYGAFSGRLLSVIWSLVANQLNNTKMIIKATR